MSPRTLWKHDRAGGLLTKMPAGWYKQVSVNSQADLSAVCESPGR